MKKYIIVSILVITFAILTYMLILQKNLNDYKTGFIIKGTYQTINLVPTNIDYLVFSDETENGKNVFYHFRQDKIKEKGYYMSSENANLYKLSIESEWDLDGDYILVDKGVAYLINKNGVKKFKKISDKEIFVNI